MKTPVTKITPELAADLTARFAEFDEACQAIGLLSAQLHGLMERHKNTGVLLNQRAERGKDISSQLAVLREVFQKYPSTLNNVATNCFYAAGLAQGIRDILQLTNSEK